MKRSLLLLCVVAVLVAAALSVPGSRDATATPIDPTSKLQWGVLLQAKRPFYPVGGTARAIYAIYNYSDQDAYGWSSVAGANGCEYRFTVLDDLGRVVWEPGSIIGGNFIPIVCLALIQPKDLPVGSRINDSVSIPLIYQNGNGIGILGDPLPAGAYKIRVQVGFNGPHRAPGTIAPGMNYSAEVPIRIE
jgi:hypothetical protein